MIPWRVDKARKIVVIGDMILDEYISGVVDRISPEAPVPVHLVREKWQSLGGAANTARNIKHAGGQVILIGAIGGDTASIEISKLLKEDDISSEDLLVIKEWETIKKLRIVSGRQQLLRVDWEKKQELENKFFSNILKKIANIPADLIVISDYGKGFFSSGLVERICIFARQRGIYTIVDPKGSDYSKYKGCSLITPNLLEAKTALSLDVSRSYSEFELACMLQKKYDLEDVLITLGAKGMLYVPKDKKKESIFQKAEASEVFDVSGAGDTVVAICALVLAEKHSVRVAIKYANIAAGLVVKKWGTQSVSLWEIENYIKKRASFRSTENKIITLEGQLEHIKNLQIEGKKIVFTNGCFDILHAGHISYLQQAAGLGDVLIVGINSDKSISAIKGNKRPIVPLEQRQLVLAALESVDYVIAFSSSTPLEIIEAISPDVLVKGSDYEVEKIVGYGWVTGRGGQVHTLPFVNGVSTSNIIESISVRD
jgi:D-beta-D-heptose 7-phosphate kinase / D-beta-D-heptose 1-phosphate adenosyltransferase